MGGGPDKEYLLLTMWGPEPVEITSKIKARFPYIDITYVDLKKEDREMLVDYGKNVSKDLYKKATILATQFSLPPSPEDAPNLKLIQLFSAGVDHLVNHPIIKDTDINITTASGIHGPPIAEWVMMTALAATKYFATTYEWQKQHQWGGDQMKELAQGTDWVGKRVGIAGYGSIGRQVARVFTALGSEVIAYTASPRPTQGSRKDTGYIVPGTGDPDGTLPIAWFSGTDKKSFHTFLRSGLDCLVICLPLTPSTIHLFSTEEFNLLQNCFIVNISRGKIIDSPALVKALNEGVLRGAALDVTDPEPLPKDDPLWDAKNVFITPHVSALGREYKGRAYDVLILNLDRLGKGEKLVNLVERKRGY